MAHGVQGSQKLFWRNVRQECERICDQNQTIVKWELLGAMQALLIYVLIRLDEGKTDHTNLDYLLGRAVNCTRAPRSQKNNTMSNHVYSSSSQRNFFTTILTAIRIIMYHVASSLKATGKTGSIKSSNEVIYRHPKQAHLLRPSSHVRHARRIRHRTFARKAASCGCTRVGIANAGKSRRKKRFLMRWVVVARLLGWIGGGCLVATRGYVG
ncbi:hypothetical protein BDW02DRAFT_610942 [Decorospora gaudefroyi]|uniref:Uncharacterized protein n=1 Tax=Decorospora gaudefroyi TaxID=184978 RepID=A0A6A5K5F6_9PLEO|nr:hypothetical protein BDW02DRAFT_610942 [Decorospora gaudefroyi]